MRTIIFIMSLLLVQQCDAQQKKNFKNINTAPDKSKNMERHNINNKFETLNLDDYKDGMKIKKEWSLEKKSYYDKYSYRKETEKEIIEIEGNIEYRLRYRKTFKNVPYYIFKEYYGKSGYIYRKRAFPKFSSIPLGEEYEFDEKGKLIKTIDHDKGWDFSYEDVMAFVKEKYGDNVEYSVKYAFNIQKKKSYDARNYWEVLVKPDFKAGKTHNYDLLKLDGQTGKILCHQQWTDNYGEPLTLRKTIVPDTTIPLSERPSAQIYKSYDGKNYTKSEWIVFEQEHYNEHLRRTGRADLIKPTEPMETPKREAKRNSFLADEDDVKPVKKKGFWG